MKDININTIDKIRFLEWIEPMGETKKNKAELTKEDKELLELIRKVKIAIEKDKLEAELKQNNQSTTRKMKI